MSHEHKDIEYQIIHRNKHNRNRQNNHRNDRIKEYSSEYRGVLDTFPECIEWIVDALKEIKSGNTRDIFDNLNDKGKDWKFDKTKINLVLYSNQDKFERMSKTDDKYPIWHLKPESEPEIENEAPVEEAKPNILQKTFASVLMNTPSKNEETFYLYIMLINYDECQDIYETICNNIKFKSNYVFHVYLYMSTNKPYFNIMNNKQFIIGMPMITTQINIHMMHDATKYMFIPQYVKFIIVGDKKNESLIEAVRILNDARREATYIDCYEDFRKQYGDGL